MLFNFSRKTYVYFLIIYFLIGFCIMTGGYGAEEKADEKIQNMCDIIKTEVESKLNREFKMFKALTFSRQVVAGINYKIKVEVDDADVITVKVFESLPYEGSKLTLINVENGEGKDL